MAVSAALAVMTVYLATYPTLYGKSTHVLFESFGSMLAMFAGLLAIIVYLSRENFLYLFLGAGLISAGLIDGYDGISSAISFEILNAHADADWTWPASRALLGVCMLIGFVLANAPHYEHSNRNAGKETIRATLLFVGGAIGAFAWVQSVVQVPTIQYYEFISGALYLAALGVLIYRFGLQYSSLYYWFGLSLAIHALAQFFAAPFSADHFDVFFASSYLFRQFGYAAALIAVSLKAYEIFTHDKENAAYLGSLFKHTGEGLISISADGKIESFNPAAENMFGYDEQEILGENVSILIPQGERMAHDGYLQRTELVENRVINKARDLLGQRKDGSVFPIDLNVSRIWRSNSQKSFIGIIRDITDRKQAEDRIEESMHLFTQAVEQSPVSVEIADRYGIVVYANNRYFETTGYNKGEVIGKTPHKSIINDMGDDNFVTQWESVFAGESWQGEYQNTRKDGELYWESVSISPIRDAEGHIKHFIAIKEDITDEKELREKLQHQTEVLEQSLVQERQYNAMHREFVTMTSHEFRTPLAIIDTAAQSLVRHSEQMEPEQKKDRLEAIRTSVVRMTDLIESSLSLSVFDAGKLAFNPEPCDVRGIVEECCRTQRAITPDMEIELSMGDDPIMINGEAKHLQRVFTNLLSNAVKYSDTSRAILISAEIDNDEVQIAVKDQGVGIPADEMPRLFERFFRASTSTGIPGTGVGLYMVKGLVEIHGGRVSVLSTQGGGSTFVACFPLLEACQGPALRVVRGQS